MTSISRTLLDLGEVTSLRQLGRALDETERLELFDLRAVERLIRRSHGHRGLGKLTRVLEGYLGPPPITRSELERLFVDLCCEARLPPPLTNILVAGFEADAAWPDRGLVVELDSWAFHRTRASFEADRDRDAALLLAGYRVLRITHRRLQREPAKVLTEIRSLLSPSPGRPGGAPAGGAPARRGGPAW